ncbi:MAG: phosphoribosylformylglycinamidine synthase subunit PurQ [Gemmatimonadota bacterium]
MRIGVVTFPGSNCDDDARRAVRLVTDEDPVYLWHKSHSLEGVDAVILPGGFSYGDYLRGGAIARFSPLMSEVVEFAESGGYVLGICNGFQMLCEAHLLPGALMKNDTLRFVCKHVRIRVEQTDTPFTCAYEEGRILRTPIAHSEGGYVADAETLDRLEAGGRVVFRYVDAGGVASEAANPNGSARNIAGITNERGNVMGMMPHPERAMESILGSTDGMGVFESLMRAASPVVTR